MNKISQQTCVGTVGELLVQIRLLSYGIQASATLKDSGNDLIAIKGHEFRAIQVRTTTSRKDPVRIKRCKGEFHILALVLLAASDNPNVISLDESRIFLIPKASAKTYFRTQKLGEFELNAARVSSLWAQ